MRAVGANRLRSIANSLFRISTQKKYKYKFAYGSSMIPHPEKAYKGGQDAMFASDNVLVVADGVGGWADQGVDPGLYSKKLCQIIKGKIKKQVNNYVNDPQKLVVQSVKQNKQVGSTTVCVLSLNPDSGKLLAYYLGDSVYGFFKSDLIQVAEDQQKAFNFPFQVGSVGDDPSHGVLHQHQIDSVQQKTIVIASDGVWDNYSLENIRKDIYQSNWQNYQAIAKKIAEGAFKHSLLQKYESPFYLKAKSQGLRTYQSGKPDDITVIVAKIKKQQVN